MRNIGRFLVILLVAFACDERSPDAIDAAVSRASVFCNTSARELGWLQALIRQSRDEPQQRGDVLAVRVDNQPLFVHQPMIMSCLGCIVYSCSGDRVETSTIDMEELILAMDDAVVIYRPY